MAKYNKTLFSCGSKNMLTRPPMYDKFCLGCMIKLLPWEPVHFINGFYLTVMPMNISMIEDAFFPSNNIK